MEEGASCARGGAGVFIAKIQGVVSLEFSWENP
jgi:hypothetical protein